MTAWYRDIVRPKILKTAPIRANDCHHCEIHVLTSEQDWINLVWALKSFYVASQRSYGLCIHDDGTLTNNSRTILHSHFPDARILSYKQSTEQILKCLQGRPNCSEFRRSNRLAPKVFDFRIQLNSERMLLFDSDVLFFDEPTELLNRIEDPDYKLNSVNADVATAYTVDPAEVKLQCGVTLIPRFNSGLGVIHRDSLNLDWAEEFLQLPGIIGHFWRIEQTLYALCSSRFGVELLPEEYGVFLEGGITCQPARHYVGAIRHLFYREGIRKLVNGGLFQSVNEALRTPRVPVLPDASLECDIRAR